MKYLVIVALLISSLTARADEIIYKVKTEQLKCLIENLKSYYTEESKVITILIDDCHNPLKSESKFKSLFNNEVPIINRSDPVDYDSFLFFYTNRLLCFGKYELDENIEYYFVNPENCTIRPGK